MEYKTLITAHSGAENTRDNTLDSIGALACCGADVVEADVRLYQGRLVTSHDEPASEADCAALEDCFREVCRHPGVRMNIDLKQGGILERVADLARECGMEKRLLFTGAVSEEDLKRARERGMPVWFNNDGLPEGVDWLQGADALGCEALNLDYADVDDALLTHADKLSVWTVDDERALRRLLTAGVKSITTHRPVLAMHLREIIQGKGAETAMKLVTFNIRGDFGCDGENNFCFRKPLILKKLADEQPDIIGFQEVMPHVAAWLRENLTEYGVVGCGREKKLDGEQATVAFRKDKYNLIEMRTFWLSETPYVPASRYASQSICPRTATELVLMEYATGKVFRVVNTHLDHEGAQARRLGLAQILSHIQQAKLFADAPVILMGDFNAPPEGEELKVFDDFPGYVNATAGVGVTYHGFDEDDPPEYIDYIYLKGAVHSLGMEKWMDVENGVYLSDHYPVCVKAALE